jgi:hypothetical protein
MQRVLFLFVVFQILISKTVDAQVIIKDSVKPNVFYGSAKSLHGKIKVINCFVSAGKNQWLETEKLDLLNMQVKALDWIKQQGEKRWAVNDITFSVSSFGVTKDIQLDTIMSDKEPSNIGINWIPLVLRKIGYNDATWFRDSIKSRNDQDNLVVIVFAKSKGRSYAQPTNSDNPVYERFTEGAIIYSEYFNNKKLNVGTVAHEILHLFGAWDLYNSKLQRPEVEQKAWQLFPRSIMLNPHNNIDELVVDQVTAWTIGWLNRYWSWYEFFRPAIDKKDKELMKAQ